jgi:hypothetical protein
MGDNKIAQRLQDCADDPMWANYAEVSQELLREAAQYIRELERDADRLKALARAVMADQTYHDTLAARVAELEQDAARYRFLRDQMHFQSGRGEAPTMTLRDSIPAPNHDPHNDWIGDRFDASVNAAIDAARKEKGHG